ncbi:MAG: hypothetical protein NVSMB5_20450 [Candidatus Velthaea sp.]
MTVVSPSNDLQSLRSANQRHVRTLIVGGGTAGLAVSERLHAAGRTEMAIVEPSDRHYY